MRALLQRLFKASARDRLGPKGERVAARALRRTGHRVLRRNLELGFGEIDLVCEAPDRRTIVFVEVKARRAGGDGAAFPPEAAVGARKRAKLLRLAQTAANRYEWNDRPLRIDVVAVEFRKRGRPIVRHHENAVAPTVG